MIYICMELLGERTELLVPFKDGGPSGPNKVGKITRLSGALRS
jgi:hypothetical protein